MGRFSGTIRVDRETRAATDDSLLERNDDMLRPEVSRAVELATSQAYALCVVANWIPQ
jgi:hypothetical protein